KQENYFLLCDVLPEDRLLRERLQQKRLEEVLEQQQQERDDGVCDDQSETMEQIYTHMKDSHDFDLHKLRTELNLRFYQQVKLVNFIRRQIHQSRCYGCEGKFLSRADVLRHIAAAGHVMKLPDVLLPHV
ncbi:unnamed protein product, partial [Pleuronectes platessa]